MPAIVYPSDLPCPQVAPIQSTERRLLSSDGGLYQARTVQRDRHAIQQITFPPFSPAQAATFRTWWEDTLVLGGNWFAATWPLPEGLVQGVRRWLEAPTWAFVSSADGGRWRVSAPCEVRGTGLAPAVSTIKEDLIAWWDGTDLVGGSELIIDQHTHALSTTDSVTGIASVVAGVNGNAVRLPAYTGPSFAVGTRIDDAFLKIGAQAFAMGRWIRLFAPFQEDSTARMLLGRWHSGPGGTVDDLSYALMYLRTPNTFRAVISSDGINGGNAHGVSAPAGIETDWHFVVASYNLAELSISVDAGPQFTVAHVGGAFAGSDAYFSFDYRSGTTHSPSGDNDLVAKATVNQDMMSAFVLGRAIRQREIDYLYNAGARRLYAELP